MFREVGDRKIITQPEGAIVNYYGKHTISQCSCGKRVTPEEWAHFVFATRTEIILKDWKDQIRFDEHPELLIHMDESSDDKEILTRDGD
ncbi:hypothetical protein NQ315_013996 [Exocentrus adspersus]|uniref:Uncharacterized protein n=1 Tax=Exocentrus adspersus TaxID=1586481 RepID=A0AAV8VH87_9CUCU|nr:hypothetical protein NQ315_013996 [Exocentrus adspersus]